MMYGKNIQEKSSLERQKSVMVSFLCFSYNHEKFLCDAIKSLQDQDYPHIEFILTDDASSDGSGDLLERSLENFKSNHSVRLIRNMENIGLICSLNNAVNEAKGDLIILCSLDDISLPQRARRIVETYNSNKDATLIVTNCHAISETGSIIHELFYDTTKAPGISKSFNDSWFLGALNCYHRSVFSSFSPLLNGGLNEDVPLSWRSNLIGKTVALNEPLVLYRRHSGSLSNRTYSELEDYRKWFCQAQITNSQLLVDLSQAMKLQSKVFHIAEWEKFAHISSFRAPAFYYFYKLKTTRPLLVAFFAFRSIFSLGMGWMVISAKISVRRLRDCIHQKKGKS